MPTVKIDQSATQLANMQTIQTDLLGKCGTFLVDQAKMYAPVDTGKLRDSIRVFSVDENQVVVGTDSPYAMSVEMGNRKTSGQPFLRPALDDLGGVIS